MTADDGDGRGPTTGRPAAATPPPSTLPGWRASAAPRPTRPGAARRLRPRGPRPRHRARRPAGAGASTAARSTSTGLTGWYLARNGSLAVDEDGKFYLMSAPTSLAVARLRGTTVAPSDPPLVAGVGGRDGESMPLRDLLRLRLGRVETGSTGDPDQLGRQRHLRAARGAPADARVDELQRLVAGSARRPGARHRALVQPRRRHRPATWSRLAGLPPRSRSTATRRTVDGRRRAALRRARADACTPQGLALHNLGSLPHISVAGAVRHRHPRLRRRQPAAWPPPSPASTLVTRRRRAAARWTARRRAASPARSSRSARSASSPA